jgi:hypothetical protein
VVLTRKSPWRLVRKKSATAVSHYLLGRGGVDLLVTKIATVHTTIIKLGRVYKTAQFWLLEDLTSLWLSNPTDSVSPVQSLVLPRRSRSDNYSANIAS